MYSIINTVLSVVVITITMIINITGKDGMAWNTCEANWQTGEASLSDTPQNT